MLDGSKSSIISIHALLAESDSVWAFPDGSVCSFLSTLSLRRATTDGLFFFDRRNTFLSTLSLRRATEGPAKLPKQIRISIHALLAESDIVMVGLLMFNLYFYPRSPCGERPYLSILFSKFFNFYPRSPCGERPVNIQRQTAENDFYPRSPCGERLFYPPVKPFKVGISIHALLAESDKPAEHHANSQQEFLSTLSLRRATVGRY